MTTHKKVKWPNTLLIIIIVVMAVGGTYVLWRHLHEVTYKQTQTTMITPIQSSPSTCTTTLQLCSSNTGDWVPLGGSEDNGDSLLLLKGGALLTYIADTSQMKPARSCPPGICTITVLSAEPAAGLPQTLLVKAITERSDYVTIEASVFLISKQSYTSQGLMANATVNLSQEISPSFPVAVNGTTYQTQLMVGNYDTGNFPTVAAAKEWFSSQGAVTGYNLLKTMKPRV